MTILLAGQSAMVRFTAPTFAFFLEIKLVKQLSPVSLSIRAYTQSHGVCSVNFWRCSPFGDRGIVIPVVLS